MLTLPENCRYQIPSPSFTKYKSTTRKYPRTKHRGPYRSYSIEEKQFVVDLHLQGKNFASISKELDIPQKNVVRWCRENYVGKPFTNRSINQNVKEGVSEWLHNHSSEDIISFLDIEKKAIELSGGTSNRPSRSWLRRFIREEDPDN